MNVLDFMMVMPMGPDFAKALSIPSARLGIIGGAYTAAAALAGLLGSLFLDRFDRRSALAVSMAGLVLGTASGGLAWGFGSLVAARALAGMFGGPATSVGLSILADVVPAERRGKAMGAVMGAFSAASVLGVPAGLELARLGGWRLPFMVVAGLGLLLIPVAIAIMPPMRMHLGRGRLVPQRPLTTFLADRTVQLSLGGTLAVFCGGFAVIPNLSSYFQQNLGYPRDALWQLYLVGGMVSFVAMRIGGAVVDRRGSVMVTVVGTLLMLADLAAGFLRPRPLVPVLAVFVCFMLANSVRQVAINTLSSRVPLPAERARFMSAQSAVQHLAAALGAVLSAALLSEKNARLVGMNRVALLSMVLVAVVPLIVAAVSRRLGAGPVPAVAVRAAGV